MNKKIPFAVMSSAAVIASVVAPPLATEAAEVEKQNTASDFSLSIMHTNDTHASVETAPKRITAIKEIREQKPKSVLIDAGDVFSGTLYFNEFKGKADLAFMNLARYDMMTFGNHEFDLGKSPEGHQALADFIKGAQFPFVSSNINFSADDTLKGLFSDLNSSDPENGKIYNGIVKEIDGEKVGFFGLTTADTANLASPEKVTFEDYLEEAEKAVAAFEGMGVDKIVAVTHIGYDDNTEIDNDLTLASQVDGIDVIVGGHSHTTLKEPVVVNKDENGAGKDPTVIVQTGANGSNLGTLDVEFDQNGKVVGHTGKLISVGDYEEDPEALDILNQYKPQVDEVSKTEIGVSTTSVLENPRTDGDNSKPSVRKNETPLGNLITDGMLAKAKEINSDTVMALQNGGGIRAAIDQGPITVGEVITVLPFGNTLALMDVTGAELKQAFEISFGQYPMENGGFLHVSGAKVDFDSSKPKGERVISISYKAEDGSYKKVQDGETYTIATNAFTAQGGDGYDVFKTAYDEGRVLDLGLSDWGNFQEHLVSLGETITPHIEGRITDVAGKTSTGSSFFQYQGEDKLKVNQIARYDSGAGEGGTEILDYDVKTKKAFVTNGAESAIDIVSFEGIESGTFKNIESTKRVYLKDLGIESVDDITSIASHPTDDLIALSVVSNPKTDPGYVVFLTKDGDYVNKVQVGALPDMVTFTPDGNKVISANEGEPNDDYSVDPEGSISIIDISNGTTGELTANNLTFEGVHLDDKVRTSSKGSVLQQLEPEYVTVSDDSKRAYVTLQENNAIATVDLENNVIIDVKGLGVKDHSVKGNELDGKENDKIEIENLPLLGFYMPDAIDTFTVGEKNYIITPNEGDARDYDAYSEESKIGKISDKVQLNADHYEGYTQAELDQLVEDGLLEELADTKITLENGKNGGVYEALYTYGGRSFSIFDGDTMELVFDSGSEFERITAEALPEYFNTTNDKVSFDKRSSAKGPEPETAVVGEIDGVNYAFIALERTSGIMVYELSNPESPEFVTFISSRDFTDDVKGDVSPEGLKFIPAKDSPTGLPLLAASHEVSGTVAVYEFTSKELKEEKPFVFSDVSKDDWAYGFINDLYQKGVVNGVTPTSYAQENSIKRVEFAAMLGRAFNIITTASTTSSFTDVPEWATNEVEALAKAGIVQGRGNGTFDPDTAISREDMALMIVRAYEHTTGTKVEIGNKTFNDSHQISPYALEAVQKLSHINIVEGRGNNEFAPLSPSTRAEAAKVVSLLMDKVK